MEASRSECNKKKRMKGERVRKGRLRETDTK